MRITLNSAPVSQSSQPRYSIVVINYNQWELTNRCVWSILKSNYNLDKVEIIVVDNNSDIAFDIAGKYHSHVRLILNSKNLLYAGGANVGIHKAQGEFVVILNNDTAVDRNWLKEIDNIMMDEHIGISQPKLLKWDTNRLDTSVPKIGRFLHCYCKGEGEEDEGQYDNEEIDYASGAAMVLRKSMLDEIGLFDESFGMYCEDLDLSLRAKKAGWKVKLIPKAKVWHIGGATAKKCPLKAKWYVFKNKLKILKKHDLRYLFI